MHGIEMFVGRDRQQRKVIFIYIQVRVALDAVLGQAGCPSAIILCFSAAKIGN